MAVRQHRIAASTRPDRRLLGQVHRIAIVLPHLSIWAAAIIGLRSTVWSPGCAGFCAVYSGFEGYFILAAAGALTLIAGIAQLLTIRHRLESGGATD